METKTFHLGDILSVTTGRLLSLRAMEGVYDILNFMTTDSLFTHQLPRASNECKPFLLAQFPQLAGVSIGEDVNSKETAMAALEKLITIYGASFEVKRIPNEAHAAKGLIEELIEILDKEDANA